MPVKQLTRRRVLGIVGGVTLAGIAGCTGPTDESRGAEDPSSDGTPTESDPDSTPDEQPPDGGDSSDDEEGEGDTDVVEVNMITDEDGWYNDPKGLLIDPGMTVRFVNESGSHSATAYHPANQDKPLRIPEAADPWDSGMLTEDSAPFEVTLDIQGVYDYYCIPHEDLGMVGRIIVGEPQAGPGTTPPDGLPPDAQDALPSIEAILEGGTVPGP